MDFVSRKTWNSLSRKNFRFRENMGEEANEERAQQIYEKSMKIEQQFGDVLTSKIEIKMIYLKFVRNIILF